MYRYGHGVKQDDKEALKWFTLSAEQGNSVSQSTLAMLS
jgi:TPR repeat protein